MQSKAIAIIGAGGRGHEFAQMFHDAQPKAKVVAVAEPREGYRQRLAQQYGLAPANVMKDWQEFVTRPKLCDAVYIATMDRDHCAPAVACMKLGYDVLLEKPLAATLADCQLIEATQRATGCIFAVCHSLRYQKGFRRVKELLEAGAIGRVMSVNLTEQVAWWHQAHSFVRGNWGNEGRSSFMLLAKSCHDIDYLHYLVGKSCLSVSSFGALSYFRAENAPAGSGARCVDCAVERTCNYSAIKQYVESKREEWPANVVALDHSRETHLSAIGSSPYGRCVWKCDNDVVDHQTVNMLFEDDVTAVFTMTAFTQGGGRVLRVHGTLGELFFEETSITIKTFGDGNTTPIKLGSETGAHGGGDQRIVDTFIDALFSRDDSQIVASAQESLKTHSVVFAAEQSRCEGRTVNLSGGK